MCSGGWVRDEERIQLDPARCRSLLGTVNLGRLALTVDAVPAVVPVAFRLVEGAVVFGCPSGGPLVRGAEGRVVAFQVDQFAPAACGAALAGWSVEVVGWAQRLDPFDLPEAVPDLRGTEPDPGDPVLLRIETRRITGTELHLPLATP